MTVEAKFKVGDYVQRVNQPELAGIVRELRWDSQVEAWNYLVQSERLNFWHAALAMFLRSTNRRKDGKDPTKGVGESQTHMELSRVTGRTALRA